MLRKILIGTMAAALFAGASVGPALSKEKIKIAFIDGLSGPFAAVGQAGLRELKVALAKYVKNDKYEIDVLALDGKTSPKESIVQLKNAISQGARYVVQGASSGVAHAIISAVNKHNKRNPDKRVLFINHAAVDPALTNEKCSFWHFRFDAHIGMKMNALTDAIAADKSIKSVYLIGQDYSFGKAVAKGAQAFLKAKRPDIKIVGNELHPIGRVKDFSPYAAKIKNSKADAVITGNWGSDMVKLARAIGESKVNAKVYTFYAAGTGITSTIGAAGKDRIYIVTEGTSNPTNDAQDAYRTAFKKKYPKSDMIYERLIVVARMFAKALDKAGSAKPVDVAKALEGMEIERLDGSKVKMRAEDHQLLMDLNIAVHTDEKIKWDFDGSGFGNVTTTKVPLDKNAVPVKGCKMKRPS